MATIVPVRFGDVSLQFGDGETPTEGFAEVCGITQYAHNININTNTEDLPDCDDPDAVSFESPFKISVGESIDFQGVVSPDNYEFYRDLAYAEDPVNIRWVINKGALEGYFQGPAILTATNVASFERRAAGTNSGTLTFTSKPVWVPAP